MAINPEEWFGATKQNPGRVRTAWVDVQDPGLREVLGVPEGGMPLQDFLGFHPSTPVAQQPAVQPGIGTAFKRGAAQSAGDIYTTLAWLTQTQPGVQEFFRRKAEAAKLRTEELPLAVPRIEDAETAGDYITWATEQLAMQVPFIASIAVPGGVAAVGAKVAGASAKAIKAAGVTASFLADAGLMTGESIGIAEENQGDVNDLRVIGSGLGKAMLDFIPFWTLAKTVGLAKPFEAAVLKRLAGQGYLKRAAGNAAVLVASEVPTETMQEVINIELDNYFTGYDGPITDEQKSQLYNAAAGATLFGVFGLYAPKRDIPPPAPEPQPEPITDKSRLLGFQPKTDFKFQDVPVSGSGEISGFDFRNLYEPKTGELRTTAKDYMRIVQEQSTVKYDPLQDLVSNPPSEAYYTVVTPGWQQRGDAWYLDAPQNNVDAGRAQITRETIPGSTGWQEVFTAFDVYGNPLGVFPDLPSAQIGATNAVYAQGKTYVFDESGVRIGGQLDQHAQFVQAIGTPTTPTELAATQIEAARPQKSPSSLTAPDAEAVVSATVNDAGLMRLLEERTEFLNNKDNYRSSDGEMKNGAAKKLEALNARIDRYRELKGLPKVDERQTTSVVGTKLDEVLAEEQNKAHAQVEAPLHPNLTAFESKQLAQLSEKEMYEGLTPKEYEDLDRLIQKDRTGRDTFGEYVPATKEELQEFSAEEQQLLKKVRKQKARFSPATRAIAKMRGIQLASKKPPLGWRDVESGAILSVGEQDKFGVSYEEISDLGELENALPGEIGDAPPYGWYVKEVEEGGGFADMGGPFKTKGEAQAQAVKLLAQREGTIENLPKAKPAPQWRAGERGEVWLWVDGKYWGQINPNIEMEGEGAKQNGWTAYAAGQGVEVTTSSLAKAKEWLLQQTVWAKPGWKAVGPFVDEVDAVNVRAKAALKRTERGTIAAYKEDRRGTYHLIGEFSSVEEAAAVAEGKTPTYVAELQRAIEQFWRSFNIRPKLVMVSNADIINGKIPLSETLQEELLMNRGLFDSGKPGTVYINIDQHKNIEDTVLTLVHEMLVHFGLRATMSKQHWAAVLHAYAKYNQDRIRNEIEAKGRSKESVALRQSSDPRDQMLADILSADELAAYVSEKTYTGNPLNPFEAKFQKDLFAVFRHWIRWAARKFLPEWLSVKVLNSLPVKDTDLALLLKDTAKALRDGDPTRPINTNFLNRKIVQSRAAEDVLMRSVDSFTSVWTAKAGGLFLSPMQFAERYNLAGVKEYLASVQKWAARKANLQNAPVELITEWQNYSKAKANRLAEALLYATSISDRKIEETGQGLTDAERVEILKQHGVTDEKGIALFNQIRQSFKILLDQIEHAQVTQTIRREVKNTGLAKRLEAAYWQDEKDTIEGKNRGEFGRLIAENNLEQFFLGSRIMKMRAEIDTMRKRDYFPYMRFGRYSVVVRATGPIVVDGKKYRGGYTDKNGREHQGQIVHFETYESYREMQNGLEEIRREYSSPAYKGKVDIGTGQVSDQEYTFLGMPPALYETLQDQLGLNAEQVERLKELYFTKSPGQRFLSNMVKRRGIRGFSQDAIRVYASYMLNAANHVARIENGQDMDAALTVIRDAANSMETSFVAGEIRDYWAKHYSYIMNPENDWAGLRAVGFLWYLGFNVKSALVNLTQVPMVAFPYLGARYGDARALAAIQSSYKEAFKILRGQALPNAELDEMVKRGVADGFLDESLATVLAGFSETSALQRLAPETDAQRRLNQVAWAGSWMFRNVEQINRFTTFLATYKLAKENLGADHKELAYAEAKEAVQSSMFEYAKWNRAEFMRGKKSVFFLFWSYMQGLAYLMAGGKGKKTAMRVWMMMLLAAGYQGIPFADNILDLIDWGSKEVKEALGMEDPYTDLRTEMRKLAQSITDNPDLLLHGWSRHYGLGPVHLLALAGVPVPEVDLSGSLSVGRWLPGTDKLTKEERDPDKKLGQTLVDVLGPVAGMGYGFFRALVDNNPDTWKSWERAMPVAMKMASSAVRRNERGEESFRSGGAIAEWDPTNPEDRVSLALNMLGFQPSKLTDAYGVIGAKENLRRYWTGRQAMVMENWAFAKRSGDPEVIADARDKLEEYNEQVPDPMLRLTPEKIRRSMKARAQKLKQREAGLPAEKGYRRLYEEIDQIYGLR